MFETKKVQVGPKTYLAPVGWSDPACSIFIGKYCRQHAKVFDETEFAQVFKRLVSFWFPKNEKFQLTLFEDLWGQYASPNSPQYFNAGIAKSYGVAGGDIGLWSIASGKPLQSYNTYVYPQLHACFIQPIEDSIGGIMKLLESEARLFSRGSGTGTNFSDLRGKEPIAGGGTSSGLISFLEVFDKMAGSIKSGGTTRRAAKMVVLDVDHPQIEEFVTWKVREEAKAQALIKAGVESNWEGEAYRTVSGQNSNNSVRIPTSFMVAVNRDEYWKLIDRTTGECTYSIKARDLWHTICYAAWSCADPGVQFSDTINKWNTTPSSGEIRASNPCSEHLRLDNSACNLASINLVSLLEGDRFNHEMFCKLVQRWVRVLDRSVDLAGYPTKDIAIGAMMNRDIGLGYCGLGALLMRLGIRYDSDEGRAMASGITALMNAVAYQESAYLAKESGSYPNYKYNGDAHLNVLNCHWLFAKHIEAEDDKHPLMKLAQKYYVGAIELAKNYGLRNAQLTVIAPTGTIGLTMDAETTGIEPLFALSTSKELAGGGHIKQVAESVQIAQERGYSPDVIQTAIDVNQVSPEGHVKMLAAVQHHISGGISKTVNLPNKATVEDVADIYKMAWQMGVKCVAVYRDGSKAQPLTAECKSCGDGEEVCAV